MRHRFNKHPPCCGSIGLIITPDLTLFNYPGTAAADDWYAPMQSAAASSAVLSLMRQTADARLTARALGSPIRLVPTRAGTVTAPTARSIVYSTHQSHNRFSPWVNT